MAENSKLTGIELNGVLYTLGKSIYEELDISLVRFAELLGRDFYCPTLNAEPTSSTLKYTDTDGTEHAFQVGQPCRWAEGSDYRIAVCKDITSSASKWYILPTKVSELANDKGYLTTHQDISGKLDASTAASTYATKTALSQLQAQLNTIVGGDSSAAIESFNEIIAFLANVEDSKTLEGIIAGINTEIAKKANKSEAIKSISRSGTTFTATRVDGTTFTFNQQDTNTTYTFAGGTNKFTVTPSGGTAQEVAVTPSIANNVTYSGTLTSGQVATFDGTGGKIKASGYTIAKSVPSDAKFTDTTYSNATTSSAGLMSSSDKSKLDGIAVGATANVGTITGIKMNGASKGASGVVDLGTVITAHQDISGKVDKVSGKGLSTNDYTTTEKNKLSGIAAGAEVNVQSDWNVSDNTSDAYIKNKPTIPAAVSESTVSGWGFTKNAGTITGIKMNGASKGTSGVVDLGTVITAHQDISGKLDSSTAASTYATKTALSQLQTQLNTIVSGDSSTAIESFNEIIAFLASVEDSETLEGIIAGINTEIAKKANKSEAIKSISRSGTTFTATRVDGTSFTFNQQDTNTTYTFSGGTNKFTVTPSGGTAQEVAVTPSITNNVTYNGTLTSGQVAILDGTAGKIKASGYTIAKSVPSDAKFTDTTYSSKTAASGGADVSLVTTGEKYVWNAKGTYSKPSTGIPKTDLDSSVQTSLGKADTALQSYTEKYTGTVTGIKMNGSSKGTSGVVDLGTVITAHQTIKQDGITGATVNRFAACSIAAATAAKTASVTGGTFALEAGSRVTVKFANANTASTPTLNINGTGAKNIFHKGAQITSGTNKSLLAGAVDFIYDGTQWHLIGNYIDTNTTYSSKDAVSGGTEVSLVTTGEKAVWNAKTSNVGTITGIKMNGSSKGASGVVDLGTVITAHQDISGKLDVSTAASTYATKTELSAKGTYSKPSGGIPKSDLASAVQTSLGKADTALQSHQDISGKINGDGTITKIVKVTALPSSPNANTLYVIV